MTRPIRAQGLPEGRDWLSHQHLIQGQPMRGVPVSMMCLPQVEGPFTPFFSGFPDLSFLLFHHGNLPPLLSPLVGVRTGQTYYKNVFDIKQVENEEEKNQNCTFRKV